MILFMEAVSAYCWTEEMRSLHRKVMELLRPKVSVITFSGMQVLIWLRVITVAQKEVHFFLTMCSTQLSFTLSHLKTSTPALHT